jgi:hypothetical protein
MQRLLDHPLALARMMTTRRMRVRASVHGLDRQPAKRLGHDRLRSKNAKSPARETGLFGESRWPQAGLIRWVVNVAARLLFQGRDTLPGLS